MTVALRPLGRLAKSFFPDIVTAFSVINQYDKNQKLRVYLTDASFVDFYWSSSMPGRFAHHWERRHIDGTIYRHDNCGHRKHSRISTFPQHFHFGSDEQLQESDLSLDPPTAVTAFLNFVRSKILDTATT